MTDEQINNKFTVDTAFRSQVQRCRGMLIARSGKSTEPPGSCTRITQAYQQSMVGARLKWTMAFVTEDHFTAFFGTPPESLNLNTQNFTDMTGASVSGVVLELNKSSWPNGLLYAELELFSESGTAFLDFVHDRNDLHDRHGTNMHQCLLNANSRSRPTELTLGGTAKPLTLAQIEQRKEQLEKKRADAAALLDGDDEAQAPIEITGSRLDHLNTSKQQGRKQSKMKKAQQSRGRGSTDLTLSPVPRRRVGAAASVKKHQQPGLQISSAASAMTAPLQSSAASLASGRTARPRHSSSSSEQLTQAPLRAQHGQHRARKFAKVIRRRSSLWAATMARP